MIYLIMFKLHDFQNDHRYTCACKGKYKLKIRDLILPLEKKKGKDNTPPTLPRSFFF